MLIIMFTRSWSDITAGIVFALHGTNPYSIPDISCSPLSLPRVISECRARSSTWALLSMTWKAKTKCLLVIPDKVHKATVLSLTFLCILDVLLRSGCLALKHRLTFATWSFLQGTNVLTNNFTKWFIKCGL